MCACVCASACARVRVYVCVYIYMCVLFLYTCVVCTMYSESVCIVVYVKLHMCAPNEAQF